jgi:Flp pilus assembly pilin Flp
VEVFNRRDHANRSLHVPARLFTPPFHICVRAGTRPAFVRVPEVGKGGESRMSSFFKSLVALSKRDEGQTMAEYGVVLAVITLAIVVALAALSGAISDAIDAVTGIL